MNQKKTTFFILLCLILLALPACTSGSDAEQDTSPTLPSFPEDATEIGTSGYYCVTAESEAVDVISTEGTRRVKVFVHQIFDPETEYIVTLTTTVTAEHSAEEDTAAVIDITAELTAAAADGFTVSEHISKNTGTVILYWNQQSVCHFQYRILPNGELFVLS